MAKEFGDWTKSDLSEQFVLTDATIQQLLEDYQCAQGLYNYYVKETLETITKEALRVESGIAKVCNCIAGKCIYTLQEQQIFEAGSTDLSRQERHNIMKAIYGLAYASALSAFDSESPDAKISTKWLFYKSYKDSIYELDAIASIYDFLWRKFSDAINCQSTVRRPGKNVKLYKKIGRANLSTICDNLDDLNAKKTRKNDSHAVEMYEGFEGTYFKFLCKNIPLCSG